MSDLFWDLFEGQVLDGKYHLRQRIGVGGYGAVFVADEVVAGRAIREVVVKLFRVAAESMEQQLRELQASTTLHHPNLIRYFAPGQFTYQFQGKTVPMLYLVMERAEESLEQRIKRRLLSPSEAESLLRQMCGVLIYLHERPEHWVHRDVKPANILWCEERWKLADLGLMRELGPRSDLTTATTVMGTPAYAPPEAFRNYVTPAWDIWSLGVVLVEALTGHLPFDGRTIEEKIHAVLHLPPAYLERLPEPFRTIAEGCLEKNPRERLTPRGIIALLDTPPKPPQTEIRWRSIWRAAMVGGVGGMVIRLLAALWLPNGGRWHPLFQFWARSGSWHEQVINNWTPAYFYQNVFRYTIFGAALDVCLFLLLYNVLNRFGKAQWLLFPISMLFSLLCILLLIGGLSFLFHVPLVSAHGSVSWIALMQQATLLGIRYLALGTALSALLFVSLLDTLTSGLCFLGILIPTLAWGVFGAIAGGLGYGFRYGVLPSVETLQRRWRMVAAGVAVLVVLTAFMAQKAVFSNPNFIKKWVWTSGTSVPPSVSGRWRGVLEGRRARLILNQLAANRFVGRIEWTTRQTEARIEGTINGNEVQLRIVPRTSPWYSEQLNGFLDSSGKLMQGWERDKRGYRIEWLLRKE